MEVKHTAPRASDALFADIDRLIAHAEGRTRMSARALEAMSRRTQFRSLLREMSSDPKRVSTNGHRIASLDQGIVAADRQRITHARVVEFLNAHEEHRPLAQPIALGGSPLFRCSTCGQTVEWETDTLVIRARDACAYPNGMDATFELNVPSGVLVVGNDFRPDFGIIGHYDINTAVGCIRTTQAMARIGCAHAFVGNTSPDVYQTGPRMFTIAMPGTHPETNREMRPKGRRVAGITTDLWWYSIVDGDEFKWRGCVRKYDVDRVRVEPGVYRFTHHGYMRDFQDPDDAVSPTVFTTIEWVRPPEPVRDYLAERKHQHFTAGQVIADAIREFPTLYHGPDRVARVADHFFCSIGNGMDWHPNGFAQENPDMDPKIRPVRIPTFAKRYRWFPLSEYSAICRAAGVGSEPRIHLNASFLALARNILHCMVRYGTEPQQPGGKDPNMALAKRCLKGLDRLYPAKRR